jgi:hypothetical protein
MGKRKWGGVRSRIAPYIYIWGYKICKLALWLDGVDEKAFHRFWYDRMKLESERENE